MQIVRTIVWVLVLVIVLLFTLANWDQQVTVRIWQNIVWDTRLPAVVIVSFLLGMLPMWMIHRGNSWRLNRRIGHLETAARHAATRTEPAPAPEATQPSPAAPAATPEQPTSEKLQSE